MNLSEFRRLYDRSPSEEEIEQHTQLDEVDNDESQITIFPAVLVIELCLIVSPPSMDTFPSKPEYW